MSILKELESHASHLTRAERKIAAFCLHHVNDFSIMTLSNLSYTIGTSTTSIIRFCQHMGFKSFKEFQTALRKETGLKVNLQDRLQHLMSESTPNVYAQTVTNTLKCIEDSFAAMDPVKMETAANYISRARRVFTFGMKEAYALAHYAYTRFYDVRTDVHLLSAVPNGDAEEILDISPEDVCIAFLFHRYTRASVSTLPIFKARGAKLILITCEPYDSVQAFADVLLPCRVDFSGVKNSYAAPVCLCDCLCNRVAAIDPERTKARMEALEKLCDDYMILGS